MTRSDYLWWIGALVVYQLYASALVANADIFDLRRKIRDIVIIWALPVVGAVLVRIALNTAKRLAQEQAQQQTTPDGR